MSPLFIYTCIIAVFWIVLCIYLMYNRRKIQSLNTLPPLKHDEPSVVIIIPVRNEEENIETALTSVCNLEYGNYHVLAIDDRSTDNTPGILNRLISQYPHLTVHRINDLPKGWLGKNYALYCGYQQSSEEWMLFTDADVNYHTMALKKAMYYATHEALDHLTILPYVKSRSSLLNAALSTFTLMLETRQRPWDIRNPASKASLGIGAFNLVKRSCYENSGTHKAIALRPDDDLKLGKQIKSSGYSQDALYGNDQVWLEWYTSTKEFIHGLMKNTFSIFNYDILLMLLTGVLPTLFFFVLPFPLLLVFGGTPERLIIVIIFIFQLVLYSSRNTIASKGWHSFFIPYAGLLIVYIMIKSSFLTLKQKGIYWRGSFYSLKDLRK
jgi:glycosyltransferase involved in cell wall biosynthesis